MHAVLALICMEHLFMSITPAQGSTDKGSVQPSSYKVSCNAHSNGTAHSVLVAAGPMQLDTDDGRARVEFCLPLASDIQQQEQQNGNVEAQPRERVRIVHRLQVPSTMFAIVQRTQMHTVLVCSHLEQRRETLP